MIFPRKIYVGIPGRLLLSNVTALFLLMDKVKYKNYYVIT